MAITLNGTSGITAPTYGGTVTAEYSVPVTSFKNRLINGNMSIDQRNAGASVTPTNGQYTLDRWAFDMSQASKLSFQQSSVAPVGFSNSLLITSTSAYSIVAGDYFAIKQSVEGFNSADLGFGTANASTITISFWVRSSLTGTFGGLLSNGANSRGYGFTYTINAANTWEQKSITIAGDTTGTWVGATNGVGLELNFGLGVGSTYSATPNTWSTGNFLSATGATSVVGTNGATFYITGVQLEKGSTATSFDYRPYGTELALCQRYYYRSNCTVNKSIATLQAYATAQAFGKLIDLPVTMRATPTASLSSVNHFFPTNTAGAGTQSFNIMTLTDTTIDRIALAGSGGSTGLTAGNATVLECNTSSAWLDATAEL